MTREESIYPVLEQNVNPQTFSSNMGEGLSELVMWRDGVRGERVEYHCMLQGVCVTWLTWRSTEGRKATFRPVLLPFLIPPESGSVTYDQAISAWHLFAKEAIWMLSMALAWTAWWSWAGNQGSKWCHSLVAGWIWMLSQHPVETSEIGCGKSSHCHFPLEEHFYH